jgi:plasmid stabilization system protein ParE
MARKPRQLEWAPAAKRDLLDIWHYFADVASPDLADTLLRNMGLQEIEWVFSATSEGWKHACEHLEPQIFLVA